MAHWPEHFFSVRNFALPLVRAPFYEPLSFAYLHGSEAVTFFFCLSGFIFYWLYADAVDGGGIGFGRFVVLRFSRLYPLHLATLLFLVLLVPIIHALLGADFVYQYNDWYHFFLNLVFAQYWGFEHGYSWNGPSWSISVEIALYTLFFVVCRTFRPSARQVTCLIVVALAAARFSIITSSAVAFFCGGLTYDRFPVCTAISIKVCRTRCYRSDDFLWALLARLTDKNSAASFVDAIRNATPAGTISGLASRAAQIFCGRVREFALFPSLIFTFAFLEFCYSFPGMAGIGWDRQYKFRRVPASFSVAMHRPLRGVVVCNAERHFRSAFYVHYSLGGTSFYLPSAAIAG